MARGRQAAAGIVAGASVPLVLIASTVAADDRPLWGINPDAQLWIAGVLAAIAGLLAALWADARSPSRVATGAVWGIVGFGIVALTAFGAGAIVGGLDGSAAWYDGWVVTTDFDEDWNATRAREALEAQGFDVTNASGQDLRAESDDVTVWLDVAENDAASSQAAFTLRVSFHDGGSKADDYQQARARAEEARPTLEDRFQELLAGFEDATGWQHTSEPRWESLIAVT